jgi:thiol-disulfide isomerase/thioredoxin
MTRLSVPSLLLLTALLISACAFAVEQAPPPNGTGDTQNVAQSDAASEELPGMPDRPDGPDGAKIGYYRNDFPEAIEATGRPQLVVFWAPNTDTSVCYTCDQLRPVVQNIEAEYWDRVDVVYINFTLPESQPGLAYFDIEDRPGQYIFFIDENGDIIRRYSLGFRAMPEEKDFRFTFDRYLNGEMDS